MRRLFWGSGILVVAVAGLALARAGATRAADPGAAAATARVARRDVGAQVKATGVIKPRVGAEVRVGSRISGVVKRLHVQIGDSVAQGQLLAELDDRDLVALRDQAAATVKQLEASSALRPSRSSPETRAFAAKSIAQSDLDVVEREVAVNEQQVEAARASLAYATAQVGYARITAPIAGVVASVATAGGRDRRRQLRRAHLRHPARSRRGSRSGPTWTRPTSGASTPARRRASLSTPTATRSSRAASPRSIRRPRSATTSSTT